MTDLEETIRQCQRGSALAWEALVRQFQVRVYSAAFYYLRNREDARDATQEVFVRVYGSIERFRSEEASFVAWLMAIARNTCIDMVRRRTTRGRVEGELRLAGTEGGERGDEPELRTSEGQRSQRLYHALDTLNESAREILLLKEIEGLKLEEIAQILQLPLGTVKSRASRAKVELAKLLAGQLDRGSGPSGTG